jgi:prepilin-type N-terminal cleavage/methylation domain-containing protein
MKGLGRKGFTLPELMTVMVIMGTLCSVGFSSMHGHLMRVKLRNTAEAVAADMRQAWWHARANSTACTVVFDTEQQGYAITGLHRASLPDGIRFGVDPTVSGKPSDPYDAPPQDGVSFDTGSIRNRTRFQPTGTVAPTGAVYLTDGKETMAVTVAITGRPKIWKSCGGHKWVSL